MTLDNIAEEEQVLVEIIDFLYKGNSQELKTDLQSYLDSASKILTREIKDRIIRDIGRIDKMLSYR